MALSKGRGNQILATEQIKVTAALGANLFIKYDGSAVAGATDNDIGVSLFATTASGQLLETVIAGVAVVTAGAATNVGDIISSDSSGRAITHTGTNLIRGKGLDAANAAGDPIRVLLGGGGTT